MLALTFVLAGANVWVTLERSLIPRSVDDVVVRVDIREEKHPGVDDVFIIELDSDEIVVDRNVAGLVREGDAIQKQAWSSDLLVAGVAHRLETSTDFRMMMLAMPLLLVCVSLALQRRNTADG